MHKDVNIIPKTFTDNPHKHTGLAGP